MRKKMIFFISIIIMIGFLCSCEKKEPAENPASDVLTAKISEQFSDFNIYVEEKKAKDLFDEENNIDFTKIENFSVRQAKQGETGIFKLYSEANVDYVKNIAEKRISVLQASSSNSGDLKELNTANNAEVRSYGNYVYYVSYGEKDRIFKIIEDALKGV